MLVGSASTHTLTRIAGSRLNGSSKEVRGVRFPESTDQDAAVALADWIDAFQAAVGDCDGLARCFAAGGYWRDILALTWSYSTWSGSAEIASALLRSARPRDLRLAPDRMAPRLVKRGGKTVVEGYIDFSTDAGDGTAFARLYSAEPGELPQAFMFLTTLQQLRGHEEAVGDRRPTGVEFSYNFSGDNWLDQRRKAAEFADRDPEVVIVGGGQAGLAVAARLGRIGVDALLIERNDRIGDNWRLRYHSLTLHNEVWANSLPYLPFPPTWPTFVPKDMLAGWLEGYADAMELNVWTGTECIGAVYDEQSATWTVRLRRPGGDPAGREVRARHLVLATGSVSGVPRLPSLPGLDSFAGEIVHSSQFSSGTRYRGQHAIVIGTGNSGHDVAQDLYSNGASVTIVQRSPTCVVSLVPSGTLVYKLYAEGPVDDIDLITAAIPYPVLRDTYQWLTAKTCELDRELLDGLQAAGFELDFGADQTGFHMKYLRQGGGYYINVGCSELIADGKIALAHARDLVTFTPDGMQLTGSDVIPADLVVLATGYETQQAGIRRLCGQQVADRVGPVWGFDEQGFMRGMWTRTGQDHLWLMGGALNECRLFSRFLALQIKADLVGLLPAR
jgi:cation diffusion facilitator CzcD-associated flavoprotein CzcO